MSPTGSSMCQTIFGRTSLERNRGQSKLVMVGMKVIGHDSSVGELALRTIVPNRKSLDVPHPEAVHQTDYHARIDSAGKERPQRYIRHQVHADAFLDQSSGPFDRLRFGDLQRFSQRHVPVPPNLGAGLTDGTVWPGSSFLIPSSIVLGAMTYRCRRNS